MIKSLKILFINKGRQLLVAFVLLLFLGWSIQAADRKLDVTTSPLDVEWDKDTEEFNFFFSIKNNDTQPVELSAILLLEAAENRWRGVRLPPIEGGQTLDFKFSLPASFMLKKPFRNLVLKVYSSDYTAFSDKSSNYQKLSINFIKGRQLQVRDQRASASAKRKQSVEINNFNLGSAEKIQQLVKRSGDERIKEVGVYVNGKLLRVHENTIFTKLPAPILMANGGDQRTLITFPKISGADFYNLYWSNQPGVKPETANKISGIEPGYLHRELENGKSYYYILTAVKDGNEGDPSDEEVVIPNPRPPKASSLELSELDSKITLTWEPQEKAEGYNLRWTNNPDEEPRRWKVIKNVQPGFEHKGLKNGITYYYQLYAFNKFGEGTPSTSIEGTPKIPKSLEIPVLELMAALRMDDFLNIEPDVSISVEIADKKLEQANRLKTAQRLQALDIRSQEQMIALYTQQGRTEELTAVLSDQLSAEPENLNLSLSLSKVYTEQGNEGAALDVLNASLNRISFSARLALNQELKNKVETGESTLSNQSEESFLAEEFARLGKSLLSKQKFEDALSAFQSLNGLAPDYPMINYNLGQSRYGLKQYNQAKERYLAQLDKKNNDPEQTYDSLHQMALVLPLSPDLRTIQKTLDLYQGQVQKGVAEERKNTTTSDIETLKNLLAETERKIKEGLPDLMIQFQGSFQFEKLQPGNEFYLGFVVQNVGKKPSSAFAVSYMLQHEQGASFEIKGADLFEALAPGAEALQFQKRLTVPETAIPGKYRLITYIQQTSSVGETSLDNNKLTSDANIEVMESSPDITLQFADLTDQIIIKPGQQLKLKLNALNLGGLRSGGFDVKYFLESNQGQRTELTGSNKIGSILQKKEEAFDASLNLPEELTEGTYQIIAKAVFPEDKGDSNLSNNEIASGFLFALVPTALDLSLAFKDEPKEIGLRPGQQLNQRVTLRNLGTQESPEVTVLFSLTSESGQNITLAEHKVSKVTGKGMEDWQHSLTLPDSIAHGTYKLTAQATLPSGNTDANEANNRIFSDYNIIIGGEAFVQDAMDPEFAQFLPPEEEAPVVEEVKPGPSSIPPLTLSAASLLLMSYDQPASSYGRGLQTNLVDLYARPSLNNTQKQNIQGQIGLVSNELQTIQQRINMDAGLLVLGLGWYGYNSFDEIPADQIQQLPEGWLKHASLLTFAMVNYYQADQYQQRIQNLTNLDSTLNGMYSSVGATEQTLISNALSAKGKLTSNLNSLSRAHMATAFVVLSMETLDLVDSLEDPTEASPTALRWNVQPDWARQAVRLSLESRW